MMIDPMISTRTRVCIADRGAPRASRDGFYADLPSRQLKVKVADRTVVRPQWDEKRLDEPAALQVTDAPLN
jgi:hypothetical protein